LEEVWFWGFQRTIFSRICHWKNPFFPGKECPRAQSASS
jgi:hypothetical protein